MSIEQPIENDVSPAVVLGGQIRAARRARGWTIAELADKLGRPREWLNRVELGYSEQGEYRPASAADIQTMVDLLGDNLELPAGRLAELGRAAEREYMAGKAERRGRRNAHGKLTQTEIIIGEKQIVAAIVDLINEQHSDAIIRNTGIKSLGNYHRVTPRWRQYREALGDFLSKNPNAIFKRVEYAATADRLDKAKEADERLAGSRKVKDVHNARIKFHRQNPLQMHVLIGQREAIIALPQTSGQAGSNIALLVRDKVFVEALRVWYDEVLWDAQGECLPVDFSAFDESFESIRKMYGFKPGPE
jgi:transcriptional regulator with XRE-family HTH domain